MGKHEMAVWPKPLMASPVRRRRRQAGSKGRIVVLLPVLVAAWFLNAADVHWYIHLLLIVFAAALPLALMCVAAVAVKAQVTERRERRRQRPRPTAVYLLLAAAWLLTGAAAALAAWAAGARSAGLGAAGADLSAAGLVWAAMISVCACAMMIGCALTADDFRRSR